MKIHLNFSIFHSVALIDTTVINFFYFCRFYFFLQSALFAFQFFFLFISLDACIVKLCKNQNSFGQIAEIIILYVSNMYLVILHKHKSHQWYQFSVQRKNQIKSKIFVQITFLPSGARTWLFFPQKTECLILFITIIRSLFILFTFIYLEFHRAQFLYSIRKFHFVSFKLQHEMKQR